MFVMWHTRVCLCVLKVFESALPLLSCVGTSSRKSWQSLKKKKKKRQKFNSILLNVPQPKTLHCFFQPPCFVLVSFVCVCLFFLWRGDSKLRLANSSRVRYLADGAEMRKETDWEMLLCGNQMLLFAYRFITSLSISLSLTLSFTFSPPKLACCSFPGNFFPTVVLFPL